MIKGIKTYSFLTVIAVLILLFSTVSFADGEKTGVTCGTGIQLRDEAVNGNIIKRLNSGIRVTIESSVSGKDGMTWYKVSSDKPAFSGYLRSDFIKGGKSASEIEEGSVYQTAYEDVKIKSAPGEKGSVLCTLPYAASCTVKSVTYADDDGYYWLNVTFDPVNNVSGGYIRYDYLNMDDFENDLRAAGFPESYIAPLVTLHDQYPNWEFKAYNPAEGTSFDKCVDAETEISVIQSLNSTGASLTGLSGTDRVETTLNAASNGGATIMSIGHLEIDSYWSPAPRSTVAYYMDPRNFILDSSGKLNPSFFMFLSGTDTEGTSEQGVKNIFSTTSMVGDIPGEGVTYSSLVYERSKTKGINPYLVAARMRQEHGSSSGDALINGPDYYNYFNIQANGDDPVKNGLAYAKSMNWNTRVKSIEGGLDYLSDGYFYSKTHKQDTLYKQRFFFAGGKCTHQYMTSIYAPHNEGKTVYQGYKTDNAAASKGVFLIPVYDNMPEKPASK